MVSPSGRLPTRKQAQKDVQGEIQITAGATAQLDSHMITSARQYESSCTHERKITANSSTEWKKGGNGNSRAMKPRVPQHPPQPRSPWLENRGNREMKRCGRFVGDSEVITDGGHADRHREWDEHVLRIGETVPPEKASAASSRNFHADGRGSRRQSAF